MEKKREKQKLLADGMRKMKKGGVYSLVTLIDNDLAVS